MVFSVASRHAGAREEGPYLVGGGVGEERLAHAGGVREHPAPDLGEHAHGVLGRHLGDVDDLVAVEQGHVRRLPGLLDQAGEVGARPGAQQPRRGLAEADQTRAEGVPSVGLLADVTARHQGAHQAVDRGQGQTAGGGELAQADLPRHRPYVRADRRRAQGTGRHRWRQGSLRKRRWCWRWTSARRGPFGAGRQGSSLPGGRRRSQCWVGTVAAGQRRFVLVADVLGKLPARFPVVVATFWIVKS